MTNNRLPDVSVMTDDYALAATSFERKKLLNSFSLKMNATRENFVMNSVIKAILFFNLGRIGLNREKKKMYICKGCTKD